MTHKERAKEATQSAGMPQWGSDDQEKLEMAVEQAITAAVEEEREACKEIAQMYVNLIREVNFPEKGAAELIRNAIMKRSANAATASESGADEG